MEQLDRDRNTSTHHVSEQKRVLWIQIPMVMQKKKTIDNP